MKKLIFAVLTLIMLLSLAACDKVQIDKTALDGIKGEYQCSDDSCPWWHLEIDGKTLTVYDNEAGNPGFKGKIITVDASTIKIRLKNVDEFPSGSWKKDGRYITLTYRKTADGIVLTNNGADVTFETDEYVE